MAEKTDLHDSDENTSEDDDSTENAADRGGSKPPSARFWHFSQLVEGNVCIGGGNIPQFDDENGRACLLKTIEQFNVEERTWRQRETKGDHHPGLTGVACASFGKYLFAYGGNNAKELNGVLSQLDLDTFTWSRLSPESADGPMRKDASAMVHFGEDSLAVVCGYAHPRDPLKHHGGSSDQQSTFLVRRVPSAEGGGWTNEMHVFNINHKTKDDLQGMWTTFSFTGSRPPPCADFSLTSVDLNRAVLYGGDRGTDENSNDLYIIDFSEKAIMKIQPENKEDRWPKMRLGQHAACCLGFNTQNPQLLMSGGRLMQHGLPPKDIWILDLATRKWKQVEQLIADDSIQRQLARWGHTFTAITHSEGLVEVIMFGGSPGYYEVTWDVYKREDFGRLSFPVSFIFGLLDKEWEILDVLDCSQRWTSKTSNLTHFDLESAIMLDVLYSMERDKIPVLTELTKNKKIRSTICSEDTKAVFKWPTFTKPSIHEPTWENLISILKLVKENDLIKGIEQYLKKMKEFVLQDVEVCDRRAFEITPSSTEPFEWKEYGLTLYPQKDCLPPGVDMITVTILSSIAGQYVFAEGCHLVSSVLWFRCLPNCALAKPIKLQMEHCANTNDLTNLVFVRASTSLSPYSFKQLEGGHFFSKGDRDYGTIELSQFCGVAVAQKGSNERKYYASLFYLGSQIIPDKIHIALTWNEPGHITKVKKEYVKKDAREAAHQVIIFDSDSITLDIPMDGKHIHGGKLIPLVYPEITKLQMDEFKIGQGTPSFQLQIIASDPVNRRLFHQLLLQGAKRPWNIFSIIINAQAPILRKRLWTDGDAEDAERPRRKLQRTKKSHSTLDADGYTCEYTASHVSNTSDDSAEEDDCIEPRRQEPVQQPQALSPHQPQLGSASESATAQQQNQTKLNFDDLPTLNELLVLKYTDKGKREKVRIVSEASHKWKTIAGLICDDANRITVLEQKVSNDPEECLRQTLTENFINKKPKKYTQDWNGLIELLDDVDLKTLAERVKDAVSVCAR